MSLLKVATLVVVVVIVSALWLPAVAFCLFVVNKKDPKKVGKKSNAEQQEMYDNVEMKERVKKPTDAEVEEVVYETVVQQLSSRKNSKSSNTAPAADGTEGSLSIEDSFSSVEGGGYENTTFELDK